MSIILDQLNRVKNMLATCKPLQRWLGISPSDPNAVAMAASRIYLDGISSGTSDTLTAEEQTNLRPYVLLIPSADTGLTWTKRAANNCWRGEGTLIIVLSRKYDSQTINDIFVDAADSVGKIISNSDANEPGLIELSDVPSNLCFNEITVLFQGRTPAEEVVNYGDAYDVVLILTYS
jgi:hypothetical protein